MELITIKGKKRNNQRIRSHRTESWYFWRSRKDELKSGQTGAGGGPRLVGDGNAPELKEAFSVRRSRPEKAQARQQNQP